MILLRNMVPNVYYDHSRDFQLLGRLYDIALNAVKTNTDMLFSLPLSADSDTRLLDLMTMTFGFKSKHEYNVQQLKSLCSCFAKIIRNKGNIQAIQDACNALVGAEGIKETIYVDIKESNPTNITLFVPQELSDLNLLKDLLTYILPAGTTCQIIKTLKMTKAIETTVKISSNVKYTKPIHGTETATIVASSADADYQNVFARRPFDAAGAFVNATVVASAKNEKDSEVNT